MSSADVFSVTWSNRVQNLASVSSCSEDASGSSWPCSTEFELEEESGWLDIFQSPVYSRAGDKLVQVMTAMSQHLSFQILLY